MTHSFDTNLPFPQEPLSLSSRLMNKVVMVAEMKATYRFSNMDFTDNISMAMVDIDFSVFQKQNQHWRADRIPFPGVISQLLCGLLITLDSFHHGKGYTIFSD